jgi:predicted nucleotidyltransferase
MEKEINIENIADDIRSILSVSPGLVKKIGVFGSLARGDYNEKSDIDLLVECNMPANFSMKLFTNYCELCNKIDETLATLYHRKIDIAHFENDSLDNLFDSDVKNEVIWI